MAKRPPAPSGPQVSVCGSLPSGYQGNVLWKPNPGPQTELFLRNEYEILYGGAKGGGKSEAGRIWLLRGNPERMSLPEASPADVSYINHSHYRALVLRRNRADMEDWIGKAKLIYGELGAEYTATPSEFTFPSGAKIVINHLAEEDTWQKYSGVEFHRMLIEELTQIPSYRLYSMVIINCRSIYEELRPQIMSTANPGGPGHGWVSKRFYTTTPTYWNNTLREKIVDPFTGEQRSITRIFIPAKLSDNLELLKTDPGYPSRLAATLSSDENMKRALLDGDWNALSGNYFTMWRPDGPLSSEVVQWPWARHVIEPINLMPYWTRWIAIDWGYKHYSIVLWGCQHPNGQVHIYRELAFSGMSPEQLGVEVALASIKDLEGQENHSMMLALSPDAFGQRTDALPISDQIKAGICSVLGEKAAYVIPTETEQAASGIERKDFFQMREFQTKQAGIGIKRADNSRIAGWMYMHSLMRFKPLVADSEPKFDRVYAEQLAMEDATRYFQYCHAFDRAKETLPLLQVWKTCPMLIAAIPTAMHDEAHNPEDVRKTNEKDDDFMDTVRYLLMYHRHAIAQVPLKQFVQDRIATSYRQDEMSGNAMFQIAERAERDYAHAGAAKPFAIRRASSRRRVN